MNDEKVSAKKLKIRKRIKETISERLKILKTPNKPSVSQKKIRRLKVRTWFKRLFLTLIIFFLLTSGALFFWITTLKIPDINEIRGLKVAQSTKIYDKTGEVLLYNLHGDETRTIIPIKNISKHLQNAAVAVEDKDFYKHKGVKISSIIKAAWENIFDDRKFKRGGSTITQQVIKNTLLTREKTYVRKIKEAILAYKLEKLWDKKQILELYLNESPYGGTIYGVEEASLYYFNKNASEVGIAEAAYLAAMPQAPTTYSPYGKNRKLLDKRKNTILSLMFNQGYINLEEYKEARDEEVEFIFKSKESGLKAPHFVMYIIKKLEEMYGKDAVRFNGLKVKTSLNYELQAKLEEMVKEKSLEAEEEYGVENAAVVAIETKTGNIIAMVGSRDYFDESIDGKVNIATSKRQPGSSFKPYVYLAAFEKGYTPETVVWDVDTEFNVKCDPSLTKEEIEKTEGCYRPKNFDWRTPHPFHGAMQLKNALPESRNIPAIKTLYLVGIEKAISTAKLLGIKSLNQPASYYGLNLVLGGGEVKLLNHVSAYGTFANEGIQVDPVGILEVRNTKDEIIYENTVEMRRVVDSKYVQNLNQVLSIDSLKFPTFGVNSDLYFEGRVASKTGTTNDSKDSWTVGYDAGNFAVGVWVGNNDSRPAKKNPGKITYSIWRESVSEVMKDYPVESFTEPPSLIEENTKPALRGITGGGATIKIDTVTGALATDETPSEFIKEIVIPSYHSILHWVNKDDPTGAIPEEKDEAYENWEYAVQKWVLENSNEVKEQIQGTITDLLSLTGGSLPKVNTEPVNIINNNNNNSLEFEFLSPGNKDSFKRDEKIYIKIREIGEENIEKYLLYVNGKYLASFRNNSFSFKSRNIENLKNENNLKVVAKGKNGSRLEKSLIFKIKD